jgi:hypothetical protein
MSKFRRRPLLLLISLLTVSVIAPQMILACDTYKYSPDGKFCFCYTLYPTEFGYDSCKVVVYDTFNGNTSCEIGGFCDPSHPYNPFDDGGGGGESGDCWWTDLYGDCILAF